MSEPDDDVERMLAVLAWWFSKLHKHTGRVHKPFNSILGEQFFCHWEVDGDGADAADGTTASSVTAVADGDSKLRVEYITEQVSHHPPVSAFIYRCKERGIEAAGMDHITAKFTGLSATVATGKECHGIFVTLKQRGDEMYKCTHPVGSIVGWLRGTLRVQMIESSYVVCARTGLAAIIEFREERWFGKNKGNVSGVVFRYDAQAHGDAIAGWRLKDIPRGCTTVATFGGNWDQRVTAQRAGEAERELIDMGALAAADRIVKPLDEQGELESRRIWEPVAAQMRQSRFGDATRLKREIEDRQRALAAARVERGETFVPALFKPGYAATGRPELLDGARVNV
ncbi:hypothetical protein H4R21_000938 [Coemansia helicoidea]|uniref:Uncharacterized protein n=1 Tax=Coemansia helicoidea TaxID=1286919 RepID=A0ACC1LER8_9FUNG|nr:hypothetical protein H4R21_000938 [Coemansia helicoidea]